MRLPSKPETPAETAWCMGAVLALTLAFIAGAAAATILVRPDRWHVPTVHAQTGEPAEFPTRIDGYRLVQAWSPVPSRAWAGGQWAPVYGPDAENFLRFPTALTGCDRTVFLYRWHVIGGADVRASIVYGWPDATISTTPVPADPDLDVTASKGWAVTDGCRTPVFGSLDPQGGPSRDVVVDVQQWTRTV